MQAISAFRFYTAVFLGSGLLAGLADAAQPIQNSPANLSPALFTAGGASVAPFAPGTSSAATNKLAMKAVVKADSGPGVRPAPRAWLTVGTNQFAFLVPEGYRMETPQGPRVSLANGDLSCVLSFGVVGPLSPDGRELTPEACREVVVTRRNRATILQEFTLYANNQGGPAFDLRWVTGGVERQERVAFIPCNGALLEFDLTSSLDQFGAGQASLNFVMLTFRASDRTGKIEISPLSDRL